MRRVLLLLAFAALASGCGESPPTDVDSPAEATWEEQVASVQSGQSDSIQVTTATVTPEQFYDLQNGCEGLSTLLLDRANMADGDLEVLASLPRLTWLKFPAPVGDDGIAKIAECSRLNVLNLPEGTFSDRGLADLARLEELHLLRFGSPNVTDDGLKELARLPGLRFLHLIDVPITDEGLRHIAEIRTLESFYLDGGHLTDAGLRRLLEARPDLHFHRDQQHLPGDPNADQHD